MVYRANSVIVYVLVSHQEVFWSCWCIQVINHCGYMYVNNSYFACVEVIMVNGGDRWATPWTNMHNNACNMILMIHGAAVVLNHVLSNNMCTALTWLCHRDADIQFVCTSAFMWAANTVEYNAKMFSPNHIFVDRRWNNYSSFWELSNCVPFIKKKGKYSLDPASQMWKLEPQLWIICWVWHCLDCEISGKYEKFVISVQKPQICSLQRKAVTFKFFLS